jgi:hypothetical protein
VAIEPQKKSVSHIPQLGDPLQFCGNGVKDVSVDNIVFFVSGMMDVLTYNREVAELQREYFIKKIVMISAEIDHFCITCCQPLHDQFKKGGVFFLPFAGLTELPSVYDIAIQDERITGMTSEKVDGFFNPGILYTEVDVRHDNGTIVRLQWFGVSQK